MQSNEILQAVYPMQKFVFSIKDTKGRRVCAFAFDASEGVKPVMARCVTEVGDEVQ